MMLGGQVPGVIFLFLTMQRTSAVFELAFALLGTPAALVLAKWYARHDTHSASLSGLSAWCQLLQCLVVALVNLSIHFRAARHQRRLHQRPRQQHQHPDSQGLKPPLRRRGPAPPPGHSAADAGGSVQAGDGSSSSGLSPAGRRKELAAPVMVTATAAHGAASAAAAAAAPESAAAAHCFDKAAPAAAPAAPAAATGSPEASVAAVQRLQRRQPPPMQPLEAPVPTVPAAAAAAPAAAQQGPAVLAAAQLAPVPPPYRSFVRRKTHLTKIGGLEPEDLSPGWQARLTEALARQGMTITGVYVRRGCVELVVEYVQLRAEAGTGIGGRRRPAEAVDSGSAAAAARLGAAPAALGFAQLLHVLRPAHFVCGAEAAESTEGTAAATAFDGSVAGAAAAAAAAHGSRHGDEIGTSDKPPPPHFLSLHPRVALLPPPAQPQPQPQRAPGVRLLLTLELGFPSPPGGSADGDGGTEVVEVLLRHRQRYLPVTVRRLRLGCGPGARKGLVTSAAVAAAGPMPAGHDEGWMERYEVDVRLGGDDSPDALVEPGLLQVDVRWGSLPYMSLPVVLLPAADAGGGAAPADAAAAAGPAAVNMAAVAEELQRFCRWFGHRGETAVTLRAAAAAAVARAGGGGAASDQEDQEEEEDVYEDEAGGMLHDLGFVLYGDGDASPGDGSSAATGAPLGGSSSPLQRCCVQLLLGRGLQQYADGNAMPHVAGLVSHHLARLQEQLAALGGGGFSSLGGISIDGHNCPAMAHCGGEAHEPTSSGSDAARVAVAAATTAATALAAASERSSDATSAVSSRADAGASSAACGSTDCSSGVKARAACGSVVGAAATARHQRRVPPAAVAAAAWYSLLLFVGLAREEPEEAAAFREARAVWNLRNAPLIEVIEVLMGVSVIARYRANAMGAGATVSFTGTVAFIGFLRCNAAFVVFTAPLLLAAWVVQPLLLALCGVPRERRAQASRRLQLLRQWVRAGPAIGVRLSAVVVSKALLLALRASPPALWLSYSAGLGLVAAEGLLLPVACVLPPLPALLLSALRMPFFAAYMASPHSGAWMPNSGAGSGVDNSSCSVTGAGHTWGDASCPAGGGEGAVSWARTAYAVWLAVRLEAVALVATWACHVCLRLRLPSLDASR
ncbi:hypothetical protein HXX76_012355 [Chlamydomonas incerta]|uniref:Uncharacterized protein n=1 Tax=Chlamydomonas incerta TaxID=51695 RepID=A0A835SI47_CHLIN|nr:hypothetical protein HXX76_012355 [Chlamydomonas incerta]|eukprot:KAG2427419.1 hypothetical protein HXX76_012355 [Chlamydomonas incerta]